MNGDAVAAAHTLLAEIKRNPVHGAFQTIIGVAPAVVDQSDLLREI
jgi:hypothetical protein